MDSRRPHVTETGTHTTDMRYFIGERDGIEYPFDRNVYRTYFFLLTAQPPLHSDGTARPTPQDRRP